MKDYKEKDFCFLEKVVTPLAMAAIEKKAIEDGASALKFMEKASFEMAKEIESSFCSENKNKNKKIKIFLLVGRGNNGGDALCIGSILLRAGFEVVAYFLFEEGFFSPLLKKMYERFLLEGGGVSFFDEKKGLSFQHPPLGPNDICIDGIFGTGFKGDVSTKIVSLLKIVNESKALKIAIDIPSGLNGENGIASNNIAFKSDLTFYLGQPKAGFFLNDGPIYIKKMMRIDFGLDEKYIDEIETQFFLINKENLSSLLPSINENQDKYKAGFVSAIAGSFGMEGAANLAGRSCLRSGAGIVKIFIAKDSKEKISDELIKLNLNQETQDVINTLNKSSSIFIGPGIGRDEKIAGKLLEIIPQIKKPLVLDADALFFLKEHLDLPFAAPVILTPHRNEMKKLLQGSDLDENQLIEKTKAFSNKYNKIVVLKGPVTFIFSPGNLPFISNFADAGMATAGAGDVLTGIISSFLAQGMEPLSAAILGVGIHSIAGRLAAVEKTSYGIIASDIVEKIPFAIKKTIQLAQKL